MKCAILLLFVILSAAMVLGQGIPTKPCPPGEHSVLYYPQKAEPSCDNPMVHTLMGPDGPIEVPCDIPQCFCDIPTVRNTKTGKCVKLSQC